jgi:hypothetical protein
LPVEDTSTMEFYSSPLDIILDSFIEICGKDRSSG